MPLLSFADLPSARALATPSPATPLPRARSAAALRLLLEQSLALPPETRNELTSHMPMALHALSELGASDARLHAFYAHYLRRFDGAPAAQPWAPAPADWLVALGDFSAFAGLRTVFAEALAEQGRDAVLKAALPRLWPGIAAAAFHGPIRVAHAVEAAHEGELAAALAYWAARWQPLASPEPASLHLPLRDWSRQLAEAAADWRSSAPLISLRMAEASATPVYRRLAGALAPAGALTARWQQLVTLALNSYADSGNFTVLHMVTGLRAVHVLSPWLAGAAVDEAVLDHAFTAAWLAARLPAMDPLGSRAVPRPAAEWPALVAAAIASQDDHVIKLVHACRELAPQVGDDRLCREAASRATRGG
ncbi:MAG TPA: questin oxidase family protein [Ideonella sp.]|uniref:questin oxidase family protein n=1 Tax=Ideonella sp. TaxID=1929293 RepID=UPI002BA3CC19|nr:questin oxidase family protein [Ideonella sp.]HSI47753.1 questin oxidase family protein [Ideonella sp.]